MTHRTTAPTTNPSRPSRALAVLAALSAPPILAASAHADVGGPDSGLITPFDNAQVSFEWVMSRAGYTGDLSAAIPNLTGESVFVFNNKAARPGETVVLSHVFNAGDPVHLTYEVTRGARDVFSTSDTDGLAQFRFTQVASGPGSAELLVGVEDIRLPGGDSDFDDVVVRMRFAQLPSPAGLTVLAFGAALCRRRRSH